MRAGLIAGWAAAAVLFGAPAAAVDNFALLDQRGRFHELHAYRDRQAVVLLVHGNGCPIARNAVPALAALEEEFAPRGVAFLLLNASPQDDRASIAAEATEYGIGLPILVDETQLVAESLGVTRTAEAFVLDPKTWEIVYRGPIDDRLDYQTQRPAREHFLRNAIAAQLGGEGIAEPVRDAPGCLILFDDPEPEITYADDIAPLLAERCGSCHRGGGVAPFALTSYEMVRGWSPMMREVIRTQRMPPWQADAHVAHFANDISLSRAEARRLVHWIEAGAPRGNGGDPLAEAPPAVRAEWALGEPDLVVEVPPQPIPATGVVPYRYEIVELPVDRDLWVRAVDLQPSRPQVMHHGLAWIRYPAEHRAPRVEGPAFTRGMFAAYVPGRDPKLLPDGAGYFVPAGSKLRFQLHYTTSGREEEDRPRLALYLSETPLAHELKTGAVSRFDFEIPPGAREHESEAELEIEHDILLYRISPHMHFRGKRMAFEAEYPDGRVEPLLSVPRWDFNWQRQYVLDPPKRIPAGTTFRIHAAFDNSELNPANPDPTATVRYGEQTFEEMMFGYFVYRELEQQVADTP